MQNVPEKEIMGHIADLFKGFADPTRVHILSLLLVLAIVLNISSSVLSLLGPKFSGKAINAISLGDIGFVATPFEMFDTTGVQIKTQSPFETTFVIGYANGGYSYLPSAEVWDYTTADGSIAFELTKCQFKQGTAEQMVEQLVSMLENLAD